MMEGCPEDNDIDEWYSAASCCDENHAANTAFHSTSRLMPYVHPLLAQTHLPTMPTCPAVTGQTLSSTSTSNMPVPMDIDATKCGGVCTLVCYHCSKMGHLHKNCPQSFDVHFMLEEERADWVQQL